MAGTLYTDGQTISGTTELLESYDAIRVALGSSSRVSLLVTGGASLLDLADELGTVGATIQLDAAFSRGIQLTTGSGDDILSGGAFGDNINAGSGHDSIYGGSGSDGLHGGRGGDRLEGGEGNDRLYGGGYGEDFLDGGAGDDLLVTGVTDAVVAYGGIGNDRIDARSTSFHAQLFGGAGDDVYVLGSAQLNVRAIVEAAGGGIDEVRMNLYTYVLPDFVENAVMVGRAARDIDGNAQSNTITGNDYGNGIRGLGGNDTIYGGGGNDSLMAGSHSRLYGGSGNDGYIVLSSNVIITEAADGGFDRVIAHTSFTLGANIETLFFGDSEVAALTGRGNGMDNKIFGHAYVDTLYGMGGNDTIRSGAGNDVVYGGDGNDSLVDMDMAYGSEGGRDSFYGGAGRDTLEGGTGRDLLDGGLGGDVYIIRYSAEAGDTIIEAAGGGVDEVLTGVDHTLAAEVENLQLYGGTRGTGNASANGITGNSDNNTLLGLSGNDVLKGGLGLDRLEGGRGDDRIWGEGGDDELSGDDGLDRLDGGAGNDLLSGGAGVDSLQGAAGIDLLLGDSGRDRLAGGGGRDLFAVATLSEAGDTVTDFSGASGEGDAFALRAEGLGGGLIADEEVTLAQFQVVAAGSVGGTTAASSQTRFIWEQDDERLWFDSNGSASGGLTLLADLQDGALLTRSDLLIL